MMILLPPSETKRSGGQEATADPSSWALPGLRAQRERVLAALIALAADPEQTRRVLKLSDRQVAAAVHDNASLRAAPVLPAVDRYTGVLFDALDASGLDRAARDWLSGHVWIHSAPFGPVAALDPIPSYRLSASASIPGLGPLRRVWKEPVRAELARAAPDFVLDLRSEAYVALGPVPEQLPSVYLRVVTAQGKALNHFNKHAKGELVRRLAIERPRIGSLRDLRGWACTAGVHVRDAEESGVVELVTESPVVGGRTG